MAITETVLNLTARPVLNNGVDQQGNVKTINGSFGASLNPSQFTPENDEASTQKLLNIGSALEDVLALTVYRFTKTKTIQFTGE